jgi:tetratricopeptide (TPR) repeat protein
MEIKLNLYCGNYDKAISLLNGMKYHIKEGATFNPHVYWFDAHLQTGIQQMKNGQHTEAEKSFLKAMEFPVNLEAERDGKIGIAWYYLGLNSKQIGDKSKAESQFAKMEDYTYSQGWGAGDFPELEYYKALASLELGKDKAEAENRFKKLITDGENKLATVKDGRHITVSVDESQSARTFLLERELGRKELRGTSYYMQGLGWLGLGQKDKARSFFTKAMEIDPLNIDPKLMLESIK